MNLCVGVGLEMPFWNSILIGSFDIPVEKTSTFVGCCTNVHQQNMCRCCRFMAAASGKEL